MGIDASIRRQLIVLARRPSARTVVWSHASPTDWRPESVHNPSGILDSHFTKESAWELIATQLENGCEVKTIELHAPRGNKGYVIELQLSASEPTLYIKIQLGSGKIIGRSFHYSYQSS